MSQGIEWAHAKHGFTLIEADDEIDGISPDSGELTVGNIGLAVDGAIVYGQPAELLELLSDGISKVSAHLAGQQ
jgi:hypothetical protein